MGVTSNVDTEEDALIDMSTCLRIDSSEESYNAKKDPSESPLAIGSACSRSYSENDDTPVDSTSPSAHSMTVSSAYSPSATITTNRAMMIVNKDEENRICKVASKII